MLNTININLKTDIKTDRPATLPIKLMSQDKNNNQFILRFTNGGESVTLDDTYTVEVLTKFTKSGTSRLTTAKVRQDYATWEFDTAYITQDETVYNYVYVRKSGNLVVSADANCFVFSVDLSEIDKGAGKVAETYDENYQKHLDEFKGNVDFEGIAQAEQARKEAETLRQESYDAKVDTAIVEADVVDKVDNKVAELTPQINDLTAQLAQKVGGGIKAEPEDLSATTLGLVTGTGGPINLLSIPQNNSVTPIKTDFISTGKNLFNATTRQIGVTLTNLETNYGGTSAISAYSVSDYIPVIPTETVTISNCRSYCLYDSFKVAVVGTYFNNPGNPTQTITIPDGAYFLRVSISDTYLNTFQIEKSATKTEYEPYKLQLDKLSFTSDQKKELLDSPASYDIEVSKSGEIFQIISDFDSSKKINIETIRNGSKNGSFNFNKTTIGTDVIHATTDDITPIRTFVTVGANHGYTSIVKVALSNHDKTIADLGSQWTDGVTVYTLLDLDVGNLIFGCPYTVADGVVSARYIAPISDLTHVSGGTNTSVVSIGSLLSSQQLYPSINNKIVRYVLDGKEIELDGTYFGNVLQVQESYNIMDYKDIIDYAKNNIGLSYKNDTIKGVVNLSITYTFTKGGNCHISHTFKALKKVTVANCGFLQSVVLTLPSHTAKRYMPNVKVKSGIDFKNIVDMSTYNTSLVFVADDYVNPEIPPNRYVDWLYSGSAKKYGFTMGYIVDKTNSKNSDRLINTVTGWDMRSSKKSYPVAMSGLTLNPGDYKSFMGYRNYLSPSEVGVATNLNIVSDKKDTYVFLDYHTSVQALNLKLSEHIGKSVTVVDSDGFVLLSDFVDSDGITFSILGSYGYAVLKIS